MARKILQISSYPPPHAGWAVRVQFLKRHLEAQGHQCVVLNIGSTRTIPSDEYETVLSGLDYVRKVWRFSRQGFAVHVHANGASAKGFVLAIVAEILCRACRQRCFLTFHAGIEQLYFPRPKYPLLFPVSWLLFALPHTIICNSKEVKAKIVEYGVQPAKVVPIPAFTRQYLESRDHHPLPPDIEAFYGAHAEVVFCYLKMRPLFYPVATVEGFARLLARRPDVGLVLCGIEGHMEPGIWPAVQVCLAQPILQGRVLVVNDLPHDAFLQALGRSTVYLRTHLSDGVCSSVLEALSLGVPVVAAENHDRPQGVITYDGGNADALASVLDDVLSRSEQIAATLRRPTVRDTLSEEAALLTA
jgi:glycosyltransferase involved in cell wall biosynthesis